MCREDVGLVGHATRQLVLAVFLFEGAAVGFAGSAVGSAAGSALVWAFNHYGPGLFAVPVPPGLALQAIVISTLVGLAAAALPALRAARLDPVVAIRYV